MLARFFLRLSASLATIERALLMGLMAAIAVFVLTNVIFRAFGTTIAWADEIAVYAMIISAFIGASLMLRARVDPAVLLVHEFASPALLRLLRGIISITCILFGLLLLYTTWRWFNPIGLISAGFDVASFEGATFNFIYTDVTPIMGLPAFWFYFVMPWFSLTITFHALANLVEDVGVVERPDNPAKIEATEI